MSVLVLTGWFPCTTPPVREGFYERDWGCPNISRQDKLDYWNGSKWFYGDGKGGYRLSVPSYSQMRWRGVRRWVLTVPDFISRGRAYVAHVSKRGVLYMTDKLHAGYGGHPYSEALSFETKAKAVEYATKNARRLHGWKAVIA